MFDVPPKSRTFGPFPTPVLLFRAGLAREVLLTVPEGVDPKRDGRFLSGRYLFNAIPAYGRLRFNPKFSTGIAKSLRF
jgi:hypothetical protein